MKIKFLIVLLWFFVQSVYGQKVPVKVVVHSIEGYGEYEVFAMQAAVLLDSIINCKEFKQRVITGNFVRSRNLTNEQLYDTIMNAHEHSGPGGQDGVVDLRLRTILVDGAESSWKNDCEGSTIGIDGLRDGVMAICPQKLKLWAEKGEVWELAGHYAHEYLHQLGFDHIRFLATGRWKRKTFVYQIGDLVSELARKSNEIPHG